MKKPPAPDPDFTQRHEAAAADAARRRAALWAAEREHNAVQTPAALSTVPEWDDLS